MTRVPMGASFTPAANVRSQGVRALTRSGRARPARISAELIAEKWDISREDNDRFSLESHLRARAATDEGRFEQEIIRCSRGRGSTAPSPRDEGIRPTRRLEKLASLKPAFKADGV